MDRPIREVYFGWSRIYDSMDRQPPMGSLEMDNDDDYTLAESTMYRDDGWRFIQIGRLIERAQLSTALLLTQLAAGAETGEAC